MPSQNGVTENLLQLFLSRGWWLSVADYPKTGWKKAVRTCATPQGDWELHAARRLTQNEIVTYKAACEKERKAMYTSGIDSEPDVEPSRKRTRPQRLQSSDSDSEMNCRSNGEMQFILHRSAQFFINLPLVYSFYLWYTGISRHCVSVCHCVCGLNIASPSLRTTNYPWKGRGHYHVTF